MSKTASTKNKIIKDLTRDDSLDDPFFIVDLEDVVKKIKYWQLRLPRVKLCYAMKCNPIFPVLRLMAHFELGLDCASKGEIEEGLKAGVKPTNIIYANPCKHKSSLRLAKSRGVTKMTFDNITELDKIAEIYPEADLVIRLKVDDSEADAPLSTKFGVERKDIPELLKHAAKLKLKIIGLSFHVGSGCKTAQNFDGAISDSRQVFDMAAKFGFKMTLLDIGGGFPGDDGYEVLFDKCAAVIEKSLEKYFPSKEYPDLELIGEPGRFVIASALTLYATVISKRVEEDQIMYYLNDGIYGSFGFKMAQIKFESRSPIPMKKHEDQTPHKSVLWGPTCDPDDVIEKNVQLPELEIGDWVLFKNMGAYTSCTASSFNGIQHPTYHYVLNPALKTELETSSVGKQLIEEITSKKAILDEKLERISNKNSHIIKVQQKKK